MTRRLSQIFHKAALPGLVAKVKLAFNTASGLIDRTIPAFVRRDNITRRLIKAGALAYVCDMWDPFPIGESIASLCGVTATLRGAYLRRKEKKLSPQPPASEALSPAHS